MLSERLGVLDAGPEAIEVLANRGFKGHVSVHVDRITGSCQNCPCQATDRIEVRTLKAPLNDSLSSVAAHKEPFASLSLELDDIERIVIGTMIRRLKPTRFALDRQQG